MQQLDNGGTLLKEIILNICKQKWVAFNGSSRRQINSSSLRNEMNYQNRRRMYSYTLVELSQGPNLYPSRWELAPPSFPVFSPTVHSLTMSALSLPPSPSLSTLSPPSVTASSRHGPSTTANQSHSRHPSPLSTSDTASLRLWLEKNHKWSLMYWSRESYESKLQEKANLQHSNSHSWGPSFIFIVHRKFEAHPFAMV
ncbi:hypothetical protein PIB30_035560 [Stylosanthes scabra]|uniref:Uncharacterized protein n=1 Tax=Stylosanthes scabra TaxID=79078 RepID=A0ABU6TF39_9FABA|nr:hypothetical protein [Stylosanthes scabra]